MVNQPTTVNWPPIIKCLVEGIEHKARMGSPACSPTDDATSEGIDYERNVNDALPSGHIGEIRKPEHVRRRREELSVHPVEQARRGLVRHSGFDGFATDDAL